MYKRLIFRVGIQLKELFHWVLRYSRWSTVWWRLRTLGITLRFLSPPPIWLIVICQGKRRLKLEIRHNLAEKKSDNLQVVWNSTVDLDGSMAVPIAEKGTQALDTDLVVH
jgi:hypothetical protein